MPYKDPAQKREYQRRWRAQRKADWLVGKFCARCGSTEDLQVDHIDPEQKVTHSIWSWSSLRRNAELAKCQVLCRPCHDKKSAGEKAKGANHGNAKLTEADVRLIKTSDARGVDLAKQFGIAKSTICDIQHGRRWNHVS